MIIINNKNYKVAGIIVECNPFHNGHKKLIKECKKNADYIIAVMSGNYVQRGEPAIHDKYKRTKELLTNGVDLVIELPVIWCLSSAKYFATACIDILNQLNFVDYLIFGSESNNIDLLSNIAKIDIDSNNPNIESQSHITYFKSKLKSGLSYPSALSKIYNCNLKPNDILGVEYIKAINSLKCKVKPICIKRDNSLPTASELRQKISHKITINDYSYILNYKILQSKSYSNQKNIFNIDDIYLMNNDFKNSILKFKNYNYSFEKAAYLLNTKNRTLANIKRTFLNMIFNIQKSDFKNHSHNNLPKNKYIRILGFKKSSKYILKNIKIPFMTSFANSSYKTFINKYPNSKIVKQCIDNSYIVDSLISKNIFADDLYYLLSNINFTESTSKLVVI